MSAPEYLPGHVATHPARHAFGHIGITLIGLFIIASFAFTVYFAKNLLVSGQLAAVVSATLVDLTNADRAEASLSTLTVNPLLVAAAQAKANDMAAKGYFAHNSPDGRTSWDWFKDAGYSYAYAGENLAVNFSDSEDVAEAWMDSPTHRANIMNGKFTEIGIATAVGEYKGKKAIFVAQMFGKPASPNFIPTTAPVENVPDTPEEPATIAVVPEPEGAAFSVIVPEESVEEVATEPDEAIIPALVEEEGAPRYGSVLGFFAASPQALLRVVYIVSALLILLALLLTTELEFKKHHFRHVIGAVFLLALMGGLLVAADWLVFTPPVIAGMSG